MHKGQAVERVLLVRCLLGNLEGLNMDPSTAHTKLGLAVCASDLSTWRYPQDPRAHWPDGLVNQPTRDSLSKQKVDGSWGRQPTLTSGFYEGATPQYYLSPTTEKLTLSCAASLSLALATWDPVSREKKIVLLQNNTTKFTMAWAAQHGGCNGCL